jgi:ribonuclease HII|tara:strand:- start:4132 stop:4791 length:660 start_codon:yes stop_codon:yes gene_type:complete
MSKKGNTLLEQYDDEHKIEVGLDEAGRGCLFGPVCIASVIWPKKDPENAMVIKDSKKCTEKYREKCYEYIINNAVAYSIQLMDHNYIDKHNILKSTLDGMHLCLDNVSKEDVEIDTILVDGNHFKQYYCSKKDDYIYHKCIVKGDDKYKSIAAASILAKTYRDNYIKELVKNNPELEKYELQKNKGYGTKKHLEALNEYGVTEWHRKTFSPCKEIIQKK